MAQSFRENIHDEHHQEHEQNFTTLYDEEFYSNKFSQLHFQISRCKGSNSQFVSIGKFWKPQDANNWVPTKRICVFSAAAWEEFKSKEQEISEILKAALDGKIQPEEEAFEEDTIGDFNNIQPQVVLNYRHISIFESNNVSFFATITRFYNSRQFYVRLAKYARGYDDQCFKLVRFCLLPAAAWSIFQSRKEEFFKAVSDAAAGKAPEINYVNITRNPEKYKDAKPYFPRRHLAPQSSNGGCGSGSGYRTGDPTCNTSNEHPARLPNSDERSNSSSSAACGRRVGPGNQYNTGDRCIANFSMPPRSCAGFNNPDHNCSISSLYGGSAPVEPHIPNQYHRGHSITGGTALKRCCNSIQINGVGIGGRNRPGTNFTKKTAVRSIADHASDFDSTEDEEESEEISEAEEEPKYENIGNRVRDEHSNPINIAGADKQQRPPHKYETRSSSAANATSAPAAGPDAAVPATEPEQASGTASACEGPTTA